MEKARIIIEKRGTAKYGYILLAFFITNVPNRTPFWGKELVTIADNEDQMELRLSPYKRRFDLEVERKYA